MRGAVAAALLGLLLGCDDGSTAGCANDLPAACPAPAPSFQAQVAPLLAARCGGCHVAGGVAPTHRFGSWAQVYPQRTALLTQTYSCLMPPLDGGLALTAAERSLLFGWLVCGAPEN